MSEVKEICPSCGSPRFSIVRDTTAHRYCSCGYYWDVFEKFAFSKLRQEIEKASLEIIKSRQYRGARESDYRAWLCDYVESNFVPKSDYEKLKAQLEKAESVIDFYSDSDNWEHKSRVQADYVVILDDSGTGEFQLNHMTDDYRVGGRRAREYFKEKESK